MTLFMRKFTLDIAAVDGFDVRVIRLKMKLDSLTQHFAVFLSIRLY
jgi:hypothetical protein